MGELLNRTNEIRREIAQIERDLTVKKTELSSLECSCNHRWGEAETIPHFHEGYTIPDRSRGSDFCPAQYVPDSTTYTYKRTCLECGKVQETDKIQEVKQPKKFEPIFP